MKIRLGLLALLAALLAPAAAQAQTSTFICLGPPGIGACTPVSATNPMPVTGSFSAGGFTPSAAGARGTPLTVTTSDSSGNLPTGAVTVVSNTGTTNPMYCNVNGVAATTSDQLISANGGWYSFTIPAAVTTLHCIATGGTTTANMLGGSGLATGTGGGSGGGITGTTSNASSAVATSATNVPVVGWLYGFNGSTWDQLQVDASKNLKVVSTNLAQGSLTSGQTGSLVMGAVTTSPPTYTTAQTSPFSLDTVGNIRTAAGGGDPCQALPKTYTPINVSASGSVKIITGAASKKTYFCHIDIVTNAANNVALTEGTGSNCGTNTFGIVGSTTAASGWNFSANGGIVLGNGGFAALGPPSGDANATAADICLNPSASTQLTGQIAWVQAP